jgi:hypothetical protein
MDPQQALRWEESALEGVWSVIPTEHQECVAALLGHLIAQAARVGALVPQHRFSRGPNPPLSIRRDRPRPSLELELQLDAGMCG